MGRYSNMILTDNNFVIIEALKRDGVGEFNRTILPNAVYEFPQNDKLNPYDYTREDIIKIVNKKSITSPKDYMNVFNGISAFLANYVFRFDNHANAFYDAINLAAIPSTFKNEKGKIDFYFNPLDSEIIDKYSSISELLDEYYYSSVIHNK